MSKAPLLEKSAEFASADIEAWNDNLWKQVRQRDGVPENFVSNVKLSNFKPSGGKGGDLMAFTDNNLYIIKELNHGDHDTLLRITESYYNHIMSDEGTLLATIYMHYCHVKSRRQFVVTRNLTPYKGPYHRRYDLKGCADDKTLERGGKSIPPVRKRIWKLHMWCSPCFLSEARRVYKKGKCDAFKLNLPVSPSHREIILKRIKRDTDWLAANNLMDYSLLVGLRKIPKGEIETNVEVKEAMEAPLGELRLPLMYEGDEDQAVLLYVGIIDYFQQWTSAKKVARCIKTLECRKATIPPKPYGKRFQKHIADMLKETAENLQKSVKFTTAAVDDDEITSNDEGMMSWFLTAAWGTLTSLIPSVPSYGEKKIKVNDIDASHVEISLEGSLPFKEHDQDVFIGEGCTLCFVAEKRPLHVLLVKKGSQMDTCGIQNDDLLVRINGNDVSTMKRVEVLRELQAAKLLTFDRPGNTPAAVGAQKNGDRV